VTAAEILWADLPREQRDALARAWEHHPGDPGQLFDGLGSDELRWECITTLHGRNGKAVAELERIAANVDPATEVLFDELVNEGAAVLTGIEEFVARFIVYPSEAARVAHVYGSPTPHRMELWESTPRIAFLSPEPGSGKSRTLEVTELVVPRAVHAVNCSPSYLFRKVSDPDGAPTVLFDEIDTIFGPRAKDTTRICAACSMPGTARALSPAVVSSAALPWRRRSCLRIAQLHSQAWTTFPTH
jgi:hypothetical protein